MSKYNWYKRGYRVFINIMLTLSLIAASIFTFAVANPNRAVAATTTVPICMIQYGWHTNAIEANIINTRPEFLVSTSYAGPWTGNADIGKFTSAGIKYFEYLDGGFEGSVWQPIPNDLYSNLNYINNIAAAGAYGVFLDEVSPYPSSTSLYYLGQIAERAHSLGLKVVFNCGTNSWSDSLMNYCDFINSSEIWSNGPLTSSQIKWASRTWLLTYNVYDAGTAAVLTNSALSQGIRAHYACTSYMALPYWLDYYVAGISYRSPGSTPVSFTSNPSGVEIWLDYSYQGVTPLTIGVAEGNHHIALAREGYLTLEGDFVASSNPFTITGDLQSGLFTSSGTEIVTSSHAPVSFTSNPSGVEVWLDYNYQGITPLTLGIAPGTHNIQFAKDGHSTLEGDFIADNTAFTIAGDLQSGQFTSTGSEIVTSVHTPVAFTSNPSGVGLWLDVSYQGVTPLTIEVTEGEHHISFIQDGYSTLEGDFIVSSNPFTIIGDLLGGEIMSNIPDDAKDKDQGIKDKDGEDAEIGDVVAKDPMVYFKITKLTTLGATLATANLNSSLYGGMFYQNNIIDLKNTETA